MKFVTSALSIVFVLSGGAKLAGLEFEIQAFERWGYAPWFMYAVGVVEVVGGLALWRPRASAAVAAGLSAVMVGAVGTHVMHAEWGMLGVASVILALSVWRAWQGAMASANPTLQQA